MAWSFPDGRRALGATLTACLVFIPGLPADGESVSVATYYPAPSGVYTRMLTTDQTWLARDAGNVGIGTSTPARKLDIVGETIARGQFHINEGWSPSQEVTINSNQIWKSMTAGDPNLYFQWSNPGGGVVVGGGPGATNNLSVYGAASVRDNLSAAAYTPPYANWASLSVGAGGAALYNDNNVYKVLMVVGNNSADGVTRRVGLWDHLDVNGSMAIIDGTQGQGKVLTSDASGNASWQAPPVAAGMIAGVQGNGSSFVPSYTIVPGVPAGKRILSVNVQLIHVFDNDPHPEPASFSAVVASDGQSFTTTSVGCAGPPWVSNCQFIDFLEWQVTY